MDRRRVVAAAAVVGLLALAGCGAPKEKLEIVCDDCENAVTETAEATNRSITVEKSVTHVYLRKSGDARVEARVAFAGADASALRDNETVIGIVRDLVGYSPEYTGKYERVDVFDSYTRPAFERENLSVVANGSVLVVTYRAENVTQRRLSAVLSTHFYRADGETRPDEYYPDTPWEIDTDRLVVYGPDGTEPIVRPPGATVRDNTVVWNDSETIDTRTYLVFGSGGPAAGLHARIVLGISVFLWAAPMVVYAGALPGVLLFGLTTLYALSYPGRVTETWDPGRDPLLWGTFGLGLAVIVVTVAWSTAPMLLPVYVTGAAVLVVGLLVLYSLGLWVYHRNTDDPFASPATTIADSIGLLSDRTPVATAAAITATLALSALVVADYRATFVSLVALVAAGVPFIGLPVLGHAVTEPDLAERRAAVVVVMAGSPWLFTLSLAVDNGADSLDTVFLFTNFWGIVAILGGSMLFYGSLRAHTD